uniref:Uncharacterized protein n=1 Tax=Sus scrofa TaxID=9823 RepID=A0A8D1ZS75_PIG
MGRYRIRVATGDSIFAGSLNSVQLGLVGARGETELELQLRPARGQEEEFGLDAPKDLGPLQFVKLRKHHSLVDDAWFCDRITVQGPGAGEEVAFPCYRWVQGDGVLCLPEGTARLAGDNALDVFQKHREKELKERRQIYCWATWKEGLPQTIAAGCEDDLPPNVRFHEEKRRDFEWTLKAGALEMVLKRVYTLLSSWNHLEDFDNIFWGQKSTLAEQVRQHWQEDELFGYQFLNGANPMLLRRCTSLPSRLVLSSGMEALRAQLEKELETPGLGKPREEEVCRGHQEELPACRGNGMDSRGTEGARDVSGDNDLPWLTSALWTRVFPGREKGGETCGGCLGVEEPSGTGGGQARRDGSTV